MVEQQEDRSGLEKYPSKFLPQMKGSIAVSKIEELRERSKKGDTITLLCHCRPGEHCHRYIIKSKIKGLSRVIESD